jgi:glycosyltransferase involved in cell wall biosynthesis
MNILVIHQNYLEKHDGGGSRFNELTKHWGSKGHNITVLAGMINHTTGFRPEIYKNNYVFVHPSENNITVIRCHLSSGYTKSFTGRLFGYFSFVFSSIYAGFFKTKGKFDIIVVTSPPLFVGITGYLLSRVKRIPMVFEVRDLWPESAIDTGILTNSWIIKLAYSFESFIYRKAARINVLTPAFRETLIQKKNVPANKISLIPNAADFSLSESLMNDFDYRLAREHFGWKEKFVITYVGAHGVANHLMQVLETAVLLKENNRVMFVLIGDGMQKAELIKFAELNDLQNVRFIDSVPKIEVFKYILASDMGMSVLQRNETFKTVYSNKTFDYMACKKPIFMLIDGVSRQLIESADCGVYVEPENPDEFAMKINEFLKRPELEIEQSGINGYFYAKENFDRKKLAEKYLLLLNNVKNAYGN